MSFIFRSIFWLALAIVVLPPEARIGGQDIADFRDVDIDYELHNAAYTAWSMASNAMEACEGNPKFCQAAAELWVTTWDTVGEIVNQMGEPVPPPAAPVETAHLQREETAKNRN